MYRKNNFEKLFIIVFVLSVVFILNIAYAKPIDADEYVKYNGNNCFNIGFESVKIKEGKGVDLNNSSARIIGDNSLVINAKDLAYPGAGIEYEAVVKNKGMMPAKLVGINTYGLNENDDIKVNTSIEEDKILKPGERINVSIIVYWDYESNNEIIPDKDFTIELGYIQSF